LEKIRHTVDTKALQREVLLGLWEIHILHPAAQRPVIGQWMNRELRRHGYEISPGTIYPFLARLEMREWLKCKNDLNRGLKDKKDYSLTEKGRGALTVLKTQVGELYREVMLSK
jgi:PadR family transcriptional regulator PadR